MGATKGNNLVEMYVKYALNCVLHGLSVLDTRGKYPSEFTEYDAEGGAPVSVWTARRE